MDTNGAIVKTDVGTSRRGLVYQRRGAGPAVLLVHGWCLDRTVWMYQEQWLVDAGFEVISPDLAGYGESRGLSGPFTLERHSADVVDLLNELELDEVTAVGFAFGAAVLVSLPDYSRLRGFVSIGIPSAAGAPYPKMRRAMLRDWPVFAERSAGAICAREHSEAALRWLGTVFARTPLNSALMGVDVLAEFEPLNVHQNWKVPTVFVHGDVDTIVSPAISQAAVDRFEGARLELVIESGHFVPWDQPIRLSEIISAFAAEER